MKLVIKTNFRMYRTILVGVELGLLQREEHRLCSKSSAGKISGPKREEVTEHGDSIC
jgi:hypothetical protein